MKRAILALMCAAMLTACKKSDAVLPYGIDNNTVPVSTADTPSCITCYLSIYESQWIEEYEDFIWCGQILTIRYCGKLTATGYEDSVYLMLPSYHRMATCQTYESIRP